MNVVLNKMARISRVALSPRVGPGPIQGERELREIEAVIYRDVRLFALRKVQKSGANRVACIEAPVPKVLHLSCVL
jgi:hypothetical protein